MSTGAKPTPKSSTVAKSGLAVGIIAFIATWWPTISPLLIAGGASPGTVQKVDVAIKIAQENSDRIQQLEDFIRSFQAKSPTPITPPVVAPDIQELQDQIKALKDLLEKQNQPPAPVQTTPPPQQLPSAIKAADGQGKPINGTVDPGQQFFVSATATGGTWTIIKSADKDVDAKVYGDEVSCVLRNGAVITIVHSSGQPITTSSLIIKCNLGAQPPPLVNVDPPSNVPPGSKRLSVYVVEDPDVKRSATTASILGNLTTRKTFADKGCTIVPVSSPTDPAAVYAKQAQIPLPAVVLFDTTAKQFIKAAPLPTDLGLSLMVSIGG